MKRLTFLTLCLAATFPLLGCGDSTPPKDSPPTTATSTAETEHHGEEEHGHDHDHEHGAGPHGGTILEWGGGKLHAEFTVDHDKKEAVVYILEGDAKTAHPIKTADGKLLLTINEPSFQVDLTAQPETGEAEGTSSRFVGQHEKLGVVQEFAGSVTGEVDGTPYAGDFKEEPHDHDHK